MAGSQARRRSTKAASPGEGDGRERRRSRAAAASTSPRRSQAGAQGRRGSGGGRRASAAAGRRASRGVALPNPDSASPPLSPPDGAGPQADAPSPPGQVDALPDLPASPIRSPPAGPQPRGGAVLASLGDGRAAAGPRPASAMAGGLPSAQLAPLPTPTTPGHRAAPLAPLRGSPEPPEKIDYKAMLTAQAAELEQRDAEGQRLLRRAEAAAQSGKRLSVAAKNERRLPQSSDSAWAGAGGGRDVAWEWEDAKGRWYPFSGEEAAALENAFASGEATLERKAAREAKTAFDLRQMQQEMLDSGTKRRIRRVAEAGWFEAVFRFAESNYAQTQRRLQVAQSGTGKELRIGKWRVGEWSTPTLSELRRDGAAVLHAASRGPCRQQLNFTNIMGDWHELMRDPANAGAMFQVAGGFNCLGGATPHQVPEDGIGGLIADGTDPQGPIMACAASAAFRNYLAPVRGIAGQSGQRQLDTLADLGSYVGNVGCVMWRMQNGFVDSDSSGLGRLNRRLAEMTAAERDQARASVRIGIHYDAEVTLAGAPSDQLVGLALCAAVSIGFSAAHAGLWAPLAQLVLEANVEAALWAAVLYHARVRAPKGDAPRPVYLALLGAGSYGNEPHSVRDAIAAAICRVRRAGVGLDVRLVHTGGCIDPFYGPLSGSSTDIRIAEDPLTGYALGDAVEVRDGDDDPWLPGTVIYIRGRQLGVKPELWNGAYSWAQVRTLVPLRPPKGSRAAGSPSDAVRRQSRRATKEPQQPPASPRSAPPPFRVGELVQVRDHEEEEWRNGYVRAISGNILSYEAHVQVDGWEEVFTFPWKFIRHVPLGLPGPRTTLSPAVDSVAPSSSAAKKLLDRAVGMVSAMKAFEVGRKKIVEAPVVVDDDPADHEDWFMRLRAMARKEKLYRCQQGHRLADLPPKESSGRLCGNCSSTSQRGGGGRMLMFWCAHRLCKNVLCRSCADALLVQRSEPGYRQRIENEEKEERRRFDKHHLARLLETAVETRQSAARLTEIAAAEVQRQLLSDHESSVRDGLLTNAFSESQDILALHASVARACPATVQLLTEAPADTLSRSGVRAGVAAVARVLPEDAWVQAVAEFSAEELRSIAESAAAFAAAFGSHPSPGACTSKWSGSLPLPVLVPREGGAEGNTLLRRWESALRHMWEQKPGDLLDELLDNCRVHRKLSPTEGLEGVGVASSLHTACAMCPVAERLVHLRTLADGLKSGLPTLGGSLGQLLLAFLCADGPDIDRMLGYDAPRQGGNQRAQAEWARYRERVGNSRNEALHVELRNVFSQMAENMRSECPPPPAARRWAKTIGTLAALAAAAAQPVAAPLHRVLHGLSEQAVAKYGALQKGDLVGWPHHTTWTRAERVAACPEAPESSAQPGADSVAFRLLGASSVALRTASPYPTEDEELLPPGSFEVSATERGPGGGLCISLRPWTARAGGTDWPARCIADASSASRRLTDAAQRLLIPQSPCSEVIVTILGSGDEEGLPMLLAAALTRAPPGAHSEFEELLQARVLACTAEQPAPAPLYLTPLEVPLDARFEPGRSPPAAVPGRALQGPLSPAGRRQSRAKLGQQPEASDSGTSPLRRRQSVVRRSVAQMAAHVIACAAALAATLAPPPSAQDLFDALKLSRADLARRVLARGHPDGFDPKQRAANAGKNALHLVAQRQVFNDTDDGLRIAKRLGEMHKLAATPQGGTSARATLWHAVRLAPPAPLRSLGRLPDFETEYVVRWAMASAKTPKEREWAVANGGSHLCPGCVRCCGCGVCAVGGHWCRRACASCGGDLSARSPPWEAWQCPLCHGVYPPGAELDPETVNVLGSQQTPPTSPTTSAPPPAQTLPRRQSVTRQSLSAPLGGRRRPQEYKADDGFEVWCCSDAVRCNWGCCSGCYRRLTGQVPADRHAHLGAIGVIPDVCQQSGGSRRKSLASAPPVTSRQTMVTHLPTGILIEDMLTHLQREMNNLGDDEEGATALHAAAANGHVAMCKVLMDCACSPDVATTRGRYPLHLAAARKNFAESPAAVAVLTRLASRRALEAGARGQERGESGALHVAVACGHDRIVARLLELGCDVDMVGAELKTALHIATETFGFALIAILVDADADTAFKHEGQTCLRKAMLQRRYLSTREGAAALARLASRAALAASDASGDLPIHTASRAGNLELLRLLLKCGANPNAGNSMGETALHIAATTGGDACWAVARVLTPLTSKVLPRELAERIPKG
eukprot:TRINITY_DN50083_c0_g1_i1.p1 TRINITY_DN50083_c0_g1~~TRINITY_DN50083_c0_g1_i1.p1  ORF type:complete len:2244 (+),score=496.87 TRINITY_DN50083_c0_g1_i1:66-6734(+)